MNGSFRPWRTEHSVFFFPRRYESVLPELFGGPGEAAGPPPAPDVGGWGRCRFNPLQLRRAFVAVTKVVARSRFHRKNRGRSRRSGVRRPSQNFAQSNCRLLSKRLVFSRRAVHNGRSVPMDGHRAPLGRQPARRRTSPGQPFCCKAATAGVARRQAVATCIDFCKSIYIFLVNGYILSISSGRRSSGKRRWEGRYGRPLGRGCPGILERKPCCHAPVRTVRRPRSCRQRLPLRPVRAW